MNLFVLCIPWCINILNCRTLLSSSILHLKESEPVIEGQLKEKKGGKWKIFKKWKSRYFTLSGAKLTYQETVSSKFPCNCILHVFGKGGGKSVSVISFVAEW